MEPNQTPLPDADEQATETPNDSVQAFAADLRALRAQAGEPKLLQLSAATQVSKSVLSDAFGGQRLPTRTTVTALITAFQGDLPAWLARRDALDPRLGRRQPEVDPPGTDPASTPAPNPPRSARAVTLRTTLLACAATAVVCIAGTSLFWSRTDPAPPPAAAASETGEPATAGATKAADYVPYADGVDPMTTICRDDAVLAASAEHLDGDVQVQMMYSNACMGVWGRVTRYDGKAIGNSLSIKIYPAIDIDSDRNQERSEFDVQSLYTRLLIEPNVDARVCGIATVTRDGETIELGPPLCI